MVARCWGIVPGLLLGGFLTVLPDVCWSFHPLRPDHQTLHFIAGFGSFLGLALSGLGWTSKPPRGLAWWQDAMVPDDRLAKFGFRVAGILTGMGLWVGATPQMGTLAAIFVAAAVSFFLAPGVGSPAKKGGPMLQFRPELWRQWGWTSAAVSLGLYLLEYAPGPFPMRLEVNHPLYAIFVGCLGELLAGLGELSIAKTIPRTRVLLGMAVPAVAALAVVLTLLFAPVDWYQIRDPCMLRFHESIGEFFPLAKASHGQIAQKLWASFGFLPLFLPVAILAAKRRKNSPFDLALFVFATAGFGVLLTAALLQVRWLANAEAHLALLAVTAALLLRPQPGRPTAAAAWTCCAALALQILLFAEKRNAEIAAVEQRTTLINDLAQMILFKRFAFAFGHHLADQNARILTDPNLVPSLQFFSGLPGVTSFYWENLAGLHAATDFLADPSPQADHARQIARSRALSHLLVTRNLYIPNVFSYVQTGDRSPARARNTLAGRLSLDPSPPVPWIQTAPEQPLIDTHRYFFRGAPIKHEYRIYALHP